MTLVDGDGCPDATEHVTRHITDGWRSVISQALGAPAHVRYPRDRAGLRAAVSIDRTGDELRGA